MKPELGKWWGSIRNPPSPRARRWRNVGAAALACLVLYTLFGFFGVPYLIRHWGISIANKRLNGSAQIERAAFNPFTFRLRLWGFKLLSEEDHRLAAFDLLDCNFDPVPSLFRWGWCFQTVHLVHPYGFARLNPDRTLNLLQAIKP